MDKGFFTVGDCYTEEKYMDNQLQNTDSAEANESASSLISQTDSALESTTTSLKTKEQFAKFSKHLPKLLIGAVLVLLIVVVGLVWSQFQSAERHVAVKQFTNVYAFVPEKVSKSAPIRISVPAGVDEATAKASITFSPEVNGTWEEEELPDTVVFMPDEPLRVGVYYAVNMDTGSVQMSGDFFVDEDPEVIKVFPAADTEAHEDTEITILFNRPMVALTTLSENEKNQLPITITPETAGRFKWISTRNLQFIPETTLVPSSKYKIEIGEGMTSVDGLPVAPFTHEFETRPLRLLTNRQSSIIFHSPLIIRFNQPVDLEETTKMLSVKSGDEEISVRVQYGTVRRYDRNAKKYVEEEDLSKLFVYQVKDRHGRKDYWDFDTSYSWSLSGAVPLFGNTNMTSGTNKTFKVPNIVKSVSAESERSSLVRPDFFDPQGKLIVTFYEDVDIEGSKINVKGFESVEYGEKCKTDEVGRSIYLGSGCELVPDQSKLIFDFKDNEFQKNEHFQLGLQKMETPDGLEINPDPISLDVTTFPEFKIYRTLPAAGSSNASLQEFVVCSNSPVANPGEAGLGSYINASDYIVFGRWSNSQYLGTTGRQGCNKGEFINVIRYGLLPEKDYTITYDLKDDFGQSTNDSVSFYTEKASSKIAQFHNLQKEYNVTVPSRTKLTYAVENLEYVDLHICKLDAETFLRRTLDQAGGGTAPRSDGCQEVKTARIELPPRYWVNNYFQVNLADYFTDTKGHYILTFSSELLTMDWHQGSGGPRYERTYISVSNLAVGKKEVEYSDPANDGREALQDNILNQELSASPNMYWINNAETLAPINGAVVTQFTHDRKFDVIDREDTVYTDYTGVAWARAYSSLAGAVIQSGFDSAVILNWSDELMGARKATSYSKTYTYTDRPIYRPGHTVYIKGIDRIGFDGAFESLPNTTADLIVTDARGGEVFATKVEINDYGTFNTEFVVPEDAALGRYTISVLGAHSGFSVEEYVPAAFKLEAETNQEEYFDGDTMKIDVQADYYFGVPLSGGTLTYGITTQDYHFDRYEGEYFKFGKGWYYCYYCSYGDQFLMRGEADIDDWGRATIEKNISFEKFFEDGESSKLFNVFITAKDASGRSVSVQKSFIVHKADFYLGVKTDRYSERVNTPVTIKAKTVDINGQEIAKKKLTRTIEKVTWETFRRQEVDGGFYYRSEERREEIDKKTIATDKFGDWQEDYTFAEEGRYSITISGEDERGNTVTSETFLYIYGTGSVLVPPNNNYELQTQLEQSELSVGDTAKLIITAPYEKAKALITAERGQVYNSWIVDVVGGVYVHEFPVKSEYTPNVHLSTLLFSPDPEVKFGSSELTVGREEHELDIAVTANKETYLPGEEVTLEVEVKDNNGSPVSAEVSLAVADLSVLALKGNPKKNPLTFFYNGFPLSVTTASNLKHILYEQDIPLGTKGGGGGSPDDLAKKKRGDFRDTAYWSATVVTDASGRATVSFTLPDNLTTWQIESLGVTKDTKLGVNYEEFTTKKQLMAVPKKPRFVVPGDQFFLGAQVFNQTDENKTVTIELSSDTLEFPDIKTDDVFVNKGESKMVYFPVTAPASMVAGTHTFTFKASADSFVDEAEQSISITPNETYETTATAHFTKEDKAFEYVYVPEEVLPDKGELTINANATLAVFMSDALEYMVTYPYGCSEQQASSLAVIALLTKAFAVPNVDGELPMIEFDGVTYSPEEVVRKGLNNIYANQKPDGGFAYYPTLKSGSSPILTLHVYEALTKLEQSGFEVREDVMSNARNYIESRSYSVHSNNYEDDLELTILAEYVLREREPNRETGLTEKVRSYISNQKFIAEDIGSLALARLAALTAGDGYSRGERNKVYQLLENRIDIDGRGAYLSSPKAANKQWYETPIKNTALLLGAYVANEDNNPMLANTLRWLLRARDKKGAWGNTHNTYSVVDAMVKYLNWQKETESHFTLFGFLKDKELFSHEFSAENIFNTFTTTVPINDLPRNELLPLTFERENHTLNESNFYYDMSLKYYLPVDSLPVRDEGITITRDIYALDDELMENPIHEAAVGEVVKGKLTITIPDPYYDVAVEDMIPAGFEIVNFSLTTEDQSLLNDELGSADGGSFAANAVSGIRDWFSGSQVAQVWNDQYRYWYGGSRDTARTRELRPDHTESHDDRVFLYIESLRPGVYEYEYFLRALVPGEFQHLPARAEELFFPENFGRTSGDIFTITVE